MAKCSKQGIENIKSSNRNTSPFFISPLLVKNVSPTDRQTDRQTDMQTNRPWKYTGIHGQKSLTEFRHQMRSGDLLSETSF